MNTLQQAFTLRKAAFFICDKAVTDCIVDDDVDTALIWLLDAYNSFVLKARYNDYCNLTDPYEATNEITRQHTNAIYVKFDDLISYLERLSEWLSGDSFTTRSIQDLECDTLTPARSRDFLAGGGLVEYDLGDTSQATPERIRQNLSCYEMHLEDFAKRNPSFSRQTWFIVIKAAIGRLENMQIKKWQKIGGGTLRLGDGTIIQPNQVFFAAANDLPKLHHNIVKPLPPLSEPKIESMDKGLKQEIKENQSQLQSQVQVKAKQEVDPSDSTFPITKHIKSKLQSEIAHNRWAEKKKQEQKVEKYVRNMLKEGCSCTHIQMKNFLWNKACDEKGALLFDHPDLTEKILLNAIKKVYKDIAPQWVTNTKTYKKPPHCHIHS